MNGCITRRDITRVYDAICTASERFAEVTATNHAPYAAWIELQEARAILRAALVQGDDLIIEDAR